VDAATDSLTRNSLKLRTQESIMDMEKKVGEAQCSVKLLNIDIGRITEDRREIVRKTINETRHYVNESDLRNFDRVLKRTRIVVMGKSTARWEKGSDSGYSVPTLFQCRDRRDQDDLMTILRSAGYYPSFHWPKEMMEFVNGVREEVRKQGIRMEDHYIRVKPDQREGKVMVKAEVRPRGEGGRFTLKGVWACPPLQRDLWDDVQDLYISKLPERY